MGGDQGSAFMNRINALIKDVPDLGKKCMAKSSKAIATKIIDKWDLIKLENFYTAKETIKGVDNLQKGIKYSQTVHLSKV